jgi:hypothetical protein
MQHSHTLEGHIVRFIAFLESWRTFDAILGNEDFNAIATHFHCTEADRSKAAMHFNWVSVRALPDPAVRSWVSERGRHKKHRI